LFAAMSGIGRCDVLTLIGKDAYRLNTIGLSMPVKKDQPPPDTAGDKMNLLRQFSVLSVATLALLLTLGVCSEAGAGAVASQGRLTSDKCKYQFN
jgi:hypothetical protein